MHVTLAMNREPVNTVEPITALEQLRDEVDRLRVRIDEATGEPDLRQPERRRQQAPYVWPDLAR